MELGNGAVPLFPGEGPDEIEASSTVSGGNWKMWETYLKIAAEVDLTEINARDAELDARKIALEDVAPFEMFDARLKLLKGYDAAIAAGCTQGEFKAIVSMAVAAGYEPPADAAIDWNLPSEDLKQLRSQVTALPYLTSIKRQDALEQMVRAGVFGEHEAVSESFYEDIRADAEFESEVTRRVFHDAVNEEARRRRKKHDQQDPPSGVTLGTLLDESDEPLAWRIDGVWPSDARMILSAQQKSGKTTIVGNIVRDLVDGTPFLGRFEVSPVVDGTVGIIDFEMSRNMLRAWYRDLGVTNTENVIMWPMRGLVDAFDIRDKDVIAQWVKLLQENDVRVLIVDCLAPIFNTFGINENSNTEVGGITTALDKLKTLAGVEDLLLIHHMGHGPERSRGASGLRGWPEVEWKLLRERDAEGNAIDSGVRFFTAYGRDVDYDGEKAIELAFDPATRSLYAAENQRTRREVQSARKKENDERLAWQAAGIVSAAGEELNTSKIIAQLSGGDRNAKSDAVKRAAELGLLTVRDGKSGAKLYSVGPAFSAQANWAAKQ